MIVFTASFFQDKQLVVVFKETSDQLWCTNNKTISPLPLPLFCTPSRQVQTIVTTIVPRPTATATDQSINPSVQDVIVARRSKQEVHQLPRLSTSIFFHFQQIDKYCQSSASKWTTTPIDAPKTMANTLCSVFRRWRLHYGRRDLVKWSLSNRSTKLALIKVSSH